MIRPIRRTIASVAETAVQKRRSRSFKKYDVLRAMDAVRAGGLEVASVEIGADGTIRLASAQAQTARSNDEFERWEGRL